MDIRRLGATGYSHGRPVVFNEVAGKWLYMDTLEPSDENPRACPWCGGLPLEGDEDACLGHIPGVTSACCGHGVERACLMFDDGTFMQGEVERVRAYGEFLKREATSE